MLSSLVLPLDWPGERTISQMHESHDWRFDFSYSGVSRGVCISRLPTISEPFFSHAWSRHGHTHPRGCGDVWDAGCKAPGRDLAHLPVQWASLAAQMVKRLPAVLETGVRSPGQEDLLEKEMAPHSSTLAWRILWTEEPGGLQSMQSHRVGQDWAASLSLSPVQ